MFRPFVERGIRLTGKSGRFGMVLPDIILLKDYPDTRRLILDELTLASIDWWGMAFSSAVIDATTVIGRKQLAPPGHEIHVGIHDPEEPLQHRIPQTDFLANPRYVFNLFLTPEKREIIKKLAGCPRLSDCFEIHEGVHSGNIREQLFVARKVDKTCQPLLFGRDEIVPYFLRWKGGYIRLAAMPQRKTPEKYANLGKRDWHEREKVLVRRTGDHVLAAVDRRGRYASNNFFLVFPKASCSLDLNGLTALLNSRLMTWYFQTIEPRKGRVFAELKIKHLETFPLPPNLHESNGCEALNQLGAERAKLAAKVIETRTPNEKAILQRTMKDADSRIDKIVCKALGLSENLIEEKTLPKELDDGEGTSDTDSKQKVPRR
jgi:hypothetical protein